MQTTVEKLAVNKALKESAACFCFACKAFRIMKTKQLAACETWTAIKQRNTSAMQNTRAGPGHGGGTPPARRACPPGEKAGEPCGRKLAFSPSGSLPFLGALRSFRNCVPKVTGAHSSFPAFRLFAKSGVQGDHPPGGWVREARSLPGAPEGNQYPETAAMAWVRADMAEMRESLSGAPFKTLSRLLAAFRRP